MATQALSPAGSGGPAPLSPRPSADHQAAIGVIGVAMLVNLLRSRRLYERAAVAGIVLAALAGLNKESRAKTFARLAAWAKRQDQRLEREVKKALT